VRRAVLRQAIATLDRRFAIVLRADALQYNILALRMTLVGVGIAATQTPDSPFLQAGQIDITLPWSAVFDRSAVGDVRLDDARLSIVRRADGITNLPSSNRAEEPGEPTEIPLRRLSVPRLALDVVDAVHDVTLTIPALTLDVGPVDGSLRMLAPGTARRAEVTTEIAALGGGVTFDGRALRVAGFALSTREASVTATGTVALFVREPRVELQLSGSGDVAGLTRWSAPDSALAGKFSLTGSVAGAISAPVVTAVLRSDALTWDTLAASGIRGRLAVDTEHLRISDLEAAVAGGHVTGGGAVTFGTRDTDLALSWSSVDIGALVRALAPASTVRPAGRATGDLSMTGDLDDIARLTIDARTSIVAAPAARRQVGLTGVARFQATGGQWRLDASPTVVGVPLEARLRGRLALPRMAASSLSGTLVVRDADLPRVIQALRTAELADLPGGVITAGTVNAEAMLSGTFERPRFAVTAAAANVTAYEATGLVIDVAASGTPEQVAVEARFQQGSGNSVEARGTLWPESQTLMASVTGRLRELAGLVTDTPMTGIVDIQFEGGGPFDALQGRGTLAVTEARYRDLRLAPLAATFEIDADAVQVSVVAEELGARATARIHLGEAPTAVVDLTIDDADMDWLARQSQSEVPLTGRVTLTAHGAGPINDWRQGDATMDIERLDAALGELPIRLSSAAHIAYRDHTIDVSSVEADVGETRLSITGRLPASSGSPTVADADALRAVMVGDLTHALAAVRAAGLMDLRDVAGTGPFALLSRVTGSVERPSIAADVEVGPAIVTPAGLPPAEALELRAHLEGGWLDLRSASGEWQKSRVSAEGRLPLRLLRSYLPAGLVGALPATTAPASLRARASSVTPLVLAPFLAADTLLQIDGVVDASIALDSPSLQVEDVEGEVRLDRLDVRVASLPVQQQEPTRITFDGGFARIAAWDWIGEGVTLGVRGQVRMVDRQSALLADGRIDLRTLTPFLRGTGMTTSGIVAPRISITGPIDDPRIDGDLALASGEIRLVEPRIIATDLSARAVLSRTQAHLTSVSGVVNGGRLTGEGAIDFGRTDPSSAQLAAHVTSMALEFPQGLRSEINVDLAAALADAPTGVSGKVSGTVTAVRSTYRDPIAVVTGLLGALRTERLRATTAEPSLLDRLVLDVRVVTDNDIVADNNLVRAQIGGDIRIIGTAGAPSVSGRATLREGGQLFLGRNVYTVESGTVDFANPTTIEPNLNVRARTRAGRETIELTLTGTPDDIDVTLRSETSPELGQADLTSLLLTGRRLDEVSGAEAQIVGEQLVGYLSGDVLGLASRVVGLDTIRLGDVDQSTLRRDPAAIAAQADPTSRLTFGKSLGETFEVTFSQSLRANDAQTWIVDYQPIPPVDLRLVSHDDDLRSYEFRHDVSFGTAGAERRAAPGERPVMKVTAVSFSGELGVPEASLRDVLGLERGDTFDFSDWQRDRDRLEQVLHRLAYREAQVSARKVESGLGVMLEYDIEAGPLTAISVTGHALSSNTMRTLEQAWSQSVIDEFLVDEARTILRRALAEDGYLEPQFTVAVDAGGAKTLQIEIAPGDRALDRRVAVEIVNGEELARSLEQWIRSERLESAAWREPAVVARTLADRLRAQGYLSADVFVGPPRIEGRTAAVVFRVTPGPAFSLRDVRFVDAGALDAELLRGAAGLVGGAAYDVAGVEAARVRVTRLYRREGFADARVSLEPIVDRNAGLVSVAFLVEAGPRQILREVSVQGSRAIRTEVVTRALGLTVGEPLGADAWLQARTRLFDTALFRRVDVALEPIEGQPLDGTERPMRAKVTVEEWPEARLRYGFQLSEERPEDQVEGTTLVPGLSADVTRRTLFGRAISVGGAAEYQRRERLGRVFASAPTLVGWPVESLATVQRSREEFADATLVTDRSGVSWEQRVRLSDRLRLSYSYRFDRDHTFDTDPTPDPFFPAFDVTVNIGRLIGGAVYDSRDNPIDTSRGSFLSSNLEYAPKAFGSGIRFVRHLGQAYHFQPWRGVILASAARVGQAAALGGQTLIPSERFYSGGAGSVRGVEEEGLGPRNVFDEPAGGSSLVVFNQEVRFPIYRWLRGVGFADAGNVFDSVAGTDLRKVVGSVGAGFRVITPLALLRVDYGRLWSPGPGERRGRWTFGIGQAF
jgi:outer membrane protein assembly factor BamA/autotransporter translocation and assembly factor TamB